MQGIRNWFARAVLPALLLASPCRADLHYSLTDFGRIDAPGVFQPAAMNNVGQIAGTFNSPAGSHAAIYNNGAIADLGTLGGAVSHSTGINDNGQVTGFSDLQSTGGPLLTHSFIYTQSGIHDLSPGATSN